MQGRRDGACREDVAIRGFLVAPAGVFIMETSKATKRAGRAKERAGARIGSAPTRAAPAAAPRREPSAQEA